MTITSQATGSSPDPAPFLAVAEVARLCRVSKMTLYRAIAAGRFPAVRIEGRLIIPAQVVEAMVQAALAGNTTVDAADWARNGNPSHDGQPASDRGIRAGER